MYGYGGNHIIVIDAAAASVGATLMKTGQTTSYRTGDDGDLEAGRATSFSVLASNNPFGNTNRFTDELGGQTYTLGIKIDWSTYDGSTVLGYGVIQGTAGTTWNNSIDGALAYTVGSFTSGWRLWNKHECENVLNYSLTNILSYAPFSFGSSYTYWISTTPNGATTNAFFMYPTIALGYHIGAQPKTASAGYAYMPVRTFTVTGTTLS